MPAQCFSTIMKDRNQMQGAKVVPGGLRDTASEIFFELQANRECQNAEIVQRT